MTTHVWVFCGVGYDQYTLGILEFKSMFFFFFLLKFLYPRAASTASFVTFRETKGKSQVMNMLPKFLKNSRDFQIFFFFLSIPHIIIIRKTLFEITRGFQEISTWKFHILNDFFRGCGDFTTVKSSYKFVM